MKSPKMGECWVLQKFIRFFGFCSETVLVRLPDFILFFCVARISRFRFPGNALADYFRRKVQYTKWQHRVAILNVK